eukprot:MONOS_11839.1-p1 / transcript=MONOS_11839.1 / gene=MONOS_11839 / organism=Monocercomonoides_exilis_PA203 / gene_product=unspecified product / transcript_product=unspecified product / location=Mono_scaffold00617:8773-9267(+) / protein_length=165 / sequence_SO=supercontig / SO=protein_coding / is_pseudo=false
MLSGPVGSFNPSPSEPPTPDPFRETVIEKLHGVSKKQKVEFEHFPGDDIPLSDDEKEEVLLSISDLPYTLFEKVIEFLELAAPGVAKPGPENFIDFEIEDMPPVVQRNLQRLSILCRLIYEETRQDLNAISTTVEAWTNGIAMDRRRPQPRKPAPKPKNKKKKK